MDKTEPSKILSSSEVKHQLRCVSTILDSLDALVYVADMSTYELIYFNQYGEQEWGEINNKPCYQVLQSDQQSPCEFCTNKKLVDSNGKPTGVHVWEFQNTVNKRWYQCRDQAIPWVDGRLVRIEIAVDITERKLMELELKQLNEQALHNARTDPLLGCLNRRAFFESSHAVLSHCKRHHRDLALIMMDVDRFKNINDKFGHAFGDEVLIQIANVIVNTVRDEDIFARYGGEEFVLLLPDATREQSLLLIERIQKNISNIKIKGMTDNFAVTLSYGLTTLSAKNDLEALLKQADIALYRAKGAGRNCAKFY